MASLVSRSILTGPDSVSCLSISSKLVASGFENGSVCLWSPPECDFPIFLLPSSSACTALKFGGENNAYALFSAHNGAIMSWDLRKVTDPMDTWEISNEEINSIDVMDSENCLAVADDDGIVHIISTKDGISFNTLQAHENICTAVNFRPNFPNQLISAGLDCRLIVNDWQSRPNKVRIFEMRDLVGVTAYMDLLGEEDIQALNLEDDEDVDSEFSHEEDDEEGDEVDENEDNLSSSQNNDHHESEEDRDSDEGYVGNSVKSSLRVASSYSRAEVAELAKTRLMGHGMGLNPPMVHCLTTTTSGDCVVLGLENHTIEVFKGDQRFLKHSESLFGHRRGVAALLTVGETHLVSGGNDCSMFVWDLAPGGAGYEFSHSRKICALAGHTMSTVYMADSSANIQVLDLSLI